VVEGNNHRATAKKPQLEDGFVSKYESGVDVGAASQLARQL
jgi:hypothetical protein